MPTFRISREADDLAVVVLLEPVDNHRRIQPAAVRQHNLLDFLLRHVDLSVNKKTPNGFGVCASHLCAADRNIPEPLIGTATTDTAVSWYHIKHSGHKHNATVIDVKPYTVVSGAPSNKALRRNSID